MPRTPLTPFLYMTQTGIQKLIRILEGEQETNINAEQYMMLYT